MRQASENDEEFGGQKFNENAGMAKEALKQFGNEELSDLMDSTGLGNHPEVIRFFFRVGKAMKEDNFSTGPSGNEQKTAAQIMFGE